MLILTEGKATHQGCFLKMQPTWVAFLLTLKQFERYEIFMENKKKETKLVFNYGVTRKLLAAGCTVVDIKPDRTNVETGKERVVHVFKNDELFQTQFEKINKEIAELKAVNEAD